MLRPLSEIFDARVQEARAAEEVGDQDSAIAAILAALKIDPDAGSLYVWLGWIHFGRRAHREALAAAMQVDEDRTADHLGSLRLRAYLSLEAGDWQAAETLLTEIQAIDRAFADRCRSELSERILALTTRPADETARPVSYLLARALPAVLPQDPSGAARRAAMQLAALALTDLDYDTAADVLGLPTDRADDQLVRDRPLAGATIFTSIAPGRLDVQKRAVSSWQTYGARVCSVNAEDEFASLRGAFENVDFVCVQRSAERLFGKPYVYMADMLHTAANTGSSSVGIFNADVMLGDGQNDDLLRAVRRSRHALVCGHRLDVDELDEAGKPGRSDRYTSGYDWFLFDRDSAARLTMPELVFGCPWWDLWLPIAAVAARVPLVTDHALRVYHRKHDLRWNEEPYLRLGRLCLSQLAKLDEIARSPSPALKLLQVIALNIDAGVCKGAPERAKLDWLSEVMRNVITNESRVILV